MLLGQAGRRLEHRRYDLAIVLRFDHWWGAALAGVARIPHRWGYATPGMGAWLTDAVPYVPGRHEVEQNLRLVEAAISKLAGASRVERLGSLRVSREEGVPPLRPPTLEPVPVGLPESWLSAERRVIIHPGTGAANKLWTIGGWATVADRLSEDDWSVALTGSPGEHKLAELIHAASERKPINLAGQTANLNQLAWLLDRAHLVLGVDSGPLHIATALGKPTLHLYGPSDETIWGPWGNPRKHRALRAPGTRPTGRLDVGSADLEGGTEMRAITVDMLLSALHDGVHNS
jgi:heptosyltransferase-2/heptosyltransferase-3